MKNTLSIFSLAALLSFFSGCSNIDINNYATNSPRLNPETFFNGKLKAHGVVKNRGGKAIRYFNADITASWLNNSGTLEEKFVFNHSTLIERR